MHQYQKILAAAIVRHDTTNDDFLKLIGELTDLLQQEIAANLPKAQSWQGARSFDTLTTTERRILQEC